MRADSFTNSNLFDPFRDGNEHNIHDADSSNKQRNSGNTSKQSCQHSGNTTNGGDHIALTLDRKVGCSRRLES